MPEFMGIVFAFIAFLSWGFGDFFIQRTARILGSFKALFLIGITGGIVLLPFVYQDFPTVSYTDWFFLVILAVVVVFTSLFDFEALRQGKIAIVEPIIGFELPLTVGLGVLIAGERLFPVQYIFIGVVFLSILLAVTTHHGKLHFHKRMFEKGAILAGVGAIGMALMNFLVGIGSQQISPLLTIWFTMTFLGVACGIYLGAKGQFRGLLGEIQKHPIPIIGQSVLDNLGWIAYASATALIPIAITTTISESYIVLAVLLGIFINKEKLQYHQYLGIAFAIVGVIILSILS